MKTEIKEFNGIEYLLLLAETPVEYDTISRFGGANAPVVGVLREIKNDNKTGKYLRFELPPMSAPTFLNQIPLAFCKDCQAEIFWLRNENTGKNAPIDAMPSDDGNCAIYSKTHYRVFAGVFLTDARAGQAELHTNHFKTCPNAANFRPQK